MKYGFLDRNPGPDSFVRRRDPRAKLAMFFSAALLIASEPVAQLEPFSAYAGLILVLALAARAEASYLASRWLAAAPFVALAACMPLVAGWGAAADTPEPGPWAASIALRAAGAVTLIALLTATTEFAKLIWAMRRLRIPQPLSLVTALAYRYLFLLYDEWRRASHARACRAPAGLKLNRAPFYTEQIGLILIRAWERAERVQGAMALRGFTGELPLRRAPQLDPLDWGFLAIGVAAFAAVRVLL